ncbi:restriction endonuclease subunit S [Lutimonas halocynthiae]|uniref:restriction endonuclease subunit S n=1 Tax=Lutimonas halocynthiae TaxID=1446477 RepID=UPI0025B3C64D|nr:restriction endonuclease subunit S [Lutimonas halocynthiae]MDN3642919.1 restriction endonuclease subunit S [Lutimonas halocynthiae]
MKSNYKKIGDFIELVDERNRDLRITKLLGLSITKEFIPSVANTVGTNMSTYKIIRKGQFACSIMQVRRDKKMPIALLQEFDKAIISQAYPVFQVIDENLLLPEYLMMWFSRSEFDRHACFLAVGGVRGSLEWGDFLEMELPIPSFEKQHEIVAEYNTVVNRIKLNEQLNQKLEETAQALYKHWFVDFEFPNKEGKPYKSSGGKMVFNEELEKQIPERWEAKRIEDVADLKYGKMLDSSLFLESGYPIFSGYGIRGYYSSYMYEESQILVLCRGVSGTGEVRLSPKQAHITNLSIVVEIDKNSVSREYYFYYLKNDNLRSLDSGSAQSQITSGDLGFHYTLIPQKGIQDIFGSHVIVVHEQLNINEKSIKKLNDLKSLFLAKMTKVELEKEIA